MKMYLDENSYFAKGTHKKCYLHPENNKLCIKMYQIGKYFQIIKLKKY